MTIRTLLLATCTSLLSLPAAAAIVQVDFIGSVTTVSTNRGATPPDISGEFPVGTEVRGSVTYDSETEPRIIGDDAFYAAITSFSIDLGDGAYSPIIPETYAANGVFGVTPTDAESPSGSDLIVFGWPQFDPIPGPSVLGANALRMQFALQAAPDAFTGNDLPDLAGMNAIIDNLTDLRGAGFVGFDNRQVVRFDIGEISARELIDDGPAPVPLPASLPLLLAGIGAVGALRRRT